MVYSVVKMTPVSSWSLITFLIVFVHVTKLVTTQELGESCGNVHNPGICKRIHECPYILKLKLSGRKYHVCSFDRYEYVCCVQRELKVGSTEPPRIEQKYIQECEQYKSNMFDTRHSFTSLTAGASPTTRVTSKCSQHSSVPLVVGGENANPKEFPHMALLGCKNNKGGYKWICGGSLISPNHILTAAHCFETECDITFARLGELDTSTDTDDAQPIDYTVDLLIPHPEYNESLKYNDIALVKLEKEVEFNEYRRPACLPYQDYSNDHQLIITGWGSKMQAGKSADHLQKAAVEPFEQSECNNAFIEEATPALPVGVRSRVQICAGSKVSDRDTCQGDSGGPLQTVHPNHPCMYTIVGVTSFGQACGTIGVPGVYTRVYHYNDWIEKVVWE